jgi:hypothetical protein
MNGYASPGQESTGLLFPAIESEREIDQSHQDLRQSQVHAAEFGERVAADFDWQKQVFRDAVKHLDAPAPPKAEQMEQYAVSRRQAIETLRFLGTADATRELARRMRGEDSGGLDYICVLGLISSPERSVARSALQEALAEPEHPIDSNFLYALRMVNSDPGGANANWREGQWKSYSRRCLSSEAKLCRSASARP